MNDAISKLVTGHALDINGTFTVTAAMARQVSISASSDITDLGDAPAKPQPVVLDPKELVNGNKMAFQDATGALVQFQNVTVSDINTYQDFKVSTDGMNKATIASNFMSRVMTGYKAPRGRQHAQVDHRHRLPGLQRHDLGPHGGRLRAVTCPA